MKELLIKSIKNTSIIILIRIFFYQLPRSRFNFIFFGSNSLVEITFFCVIFDELEILITRHFFSRFQVTDTNDNPPSFSEPAYSFDIPENAPRGYQVGLISATDPDLGANSMLTYTVISDWANDVFSLNPQTGVFTLTARLDYEEVSWVHKRKNSPKADKSFSELTERKAKKSLLQIRTSTDEKSFFSLYSVFILEKLKKKKTFTKQKKNKTRKHFEKD